MKTRSCPGCLKGRAEGYCSSCLGKLFGGKKVSPVLPFSKPEYDRAKLSQGGRISISGIQTKHSLKLEGKTLALTDHDGQYILKPVPHGSFEKLGQMPANEHATMQLAHQVFDLNTALNAMVFFSGGEPAYLTKRFDRNPDGSKSLQEDFAQIAQRTEETHGKDYKYDNSYEAIGELLKTHVGPYAIESEKLFELVAFNYLVQNGDAHIKNFSLIRDGGQGIYILTPAYDLINTRIHLPDESDMALDLFKDGFETASFKANAYYARDDFVAFGRKLGMKEGRVAKSLDKFTTRLDRVKPLIDQSYLDKPTRAEYLAQVADRVGRLSYSFETIRKKKSSSKKI